eukprot:562872-Pleurochrysis_carterae.AAC.1
MGAPRVHNERCALSAPCSPRHAWARGGDAGWNCESLQRVLRMKLRRRMERLRRPGGGGKYGGVASLHRREANRMKLPLMCRDHRRGV